MASTEPTRLYEEAMVRLAEHIRKGKLKPGDRLPSERDLAARMKISRATLREALRVMQLQGMLVSRRGAGNYISGGNAQDLARTLDHLALKDIFELRFLIEPSIAALAAQRGTADDISRLETILRKQEQQIQQSRNIAESDTEFHAALATATHNHALVQIDATLMQIIAPSRNKSLQTSRRARSSLVSHCAILDAVRTRDPQRAQREMEEHIRSVDRGLFGLPENIFVLRIPTPQEVTT